MFSMGSRRMEEDKVNASSLVTFRGTYHSLKVLGAFGSNTIRNGVNFSAF